MHRRDDVYLVASVVGGDVAFGLVGGKHLRSFLFRYGGRVENGVGKNDFLRLAGGDRLYLQRIVARRQRRKSGWKRVLLLFLGGGSFGDFVLRRQLVTFICIIKERTNRFYCRNVLSLFLFCDMI